MPAEVANMKAQLSHDEVEARRAAARRTALILGGIALFLFALSIVEVVLRK